MLNDLLGLAIHPEGCHDRGGSWSVLAHTHFENHTEQPEVSQRQMKENERKRAIIQILYRETS